MTCGFGSKMVAIAVHTGNQNDVAALARTICTENQFNNETLRILLGCLTPGLRGTDAFIERNLTKWSLRINRIWDMGVATRKLREANRSSVDSEQETERLVVAMDVDDDQPTPAAPSKTDGLLRWSTTANRWVPGNRTKGVVDEGEEADDGGDGGDEDDPAEPVSPTSQQELTRLPTKRTPLGRLIQGSMLNSSKVNHGALCTWTNTCHNDLRTERSAIDYLFEAHEVQPDDPMLCLSLAISTLGRSLGRRADNRQQLIVQVRVSYKMEPIP
jgi:general transcription factor 3C polypeptide 3 (transcription factor C subunit 4)